MTNKTSKQDSVDAKKGNHGFTLLEVLIGIIILSVGLLGMAALTVGIINGNTFSKNSSTATTLAQDKMEELRAQNYSDVAGETKASLASPFANYKRQVVVDTATLTDMQIVTVTVYWTAKDGEHSFQYKTIFSQTE